MSSRDQLAERFELERPHLRAIAYRMLGSVTEADDAVQEAWIRLQRKDIERPDDLRGWLTVVVSRICLDALRSRRSRREDYAGTWLPEPMLTPVAPDDPERDTILADMVGVALLVVLEQLSPAERPRVRPLRRVRPPVRGHRRYRRPIARRRAAAGQPGTSAGPAAGPREDADIRVERRVVDAFLAAARAGDFKALLRVLDPDVVFRTDGGGTGVLARPPLTGARAVARQITTTGPRLAGLARPVLVNGRPGVIVDAPDQPRVVIAFAVSGGRIAAIDLMGDAAKLGDANRAVPRQ